MKESLSQTRKRIKLERVLQHSDDAASAALIITKKLCRHPAIQRANNIAIYLAAFGEVNCEHFAHQMQKRGKTIFAPILRKNRMLFAPLGNTPRFTTNHFGVAEPVYKQAHLLKPEQLEIVIAPLVAFDAGLNRIGMGGGYYDRSFAFRKRRQHWRKPLLIGVAYSFQRAPSLSPQAWDVPLDVVITEKESYGST